MDMMKYSKDILENDLKLYVEMKIDGCKYVMDCDYSYDTIHIDDLKKMVKSLDTRCYLCRNEFMQKEKYVLFPKFDGILNVYEVSCKIKKGEKTFVKLYSEQEEIIRSKILNNLKIKEVFEYLLEKNLISRFYNDPECCLCKICEEGISME